MQPNAEQTRRRQTMSAFKLPPTKSSPITCAPLTTGKIPMSSSNFSVPSNLRRSLFPGENKVGTRHEPMAKRATKNQKKIIEQTPPPNPAVATPRSLRSARRQTTANSTPPAQKPTDFSSPLKSTANKRRVSPLINSVLRKRAAVDTPVVVDIKSSTPSTLSRSRRRTLFTPNKLIVEMPSTPSPAKRQKYIELPGEDDDDQMDSTTKSVTPLGSPATKSFYSEQELPAIPAVNRRKTIIQEYNTTFSSTRESSGRRTIFDISQDILAQRLQNINRIAADAAAAAAKERSYSERNVADSFEELVALGSASAVCRTPSGDDVVKKRKLYTPPHMAPISANNSITILDRRTSQTIVLDVSHDSSFDYLKDDEDDMKTDDEPPAVGVKTENKSDGETAAKKNRLTKKEETVAKMSTPLRSTRRRTMIFNV